MKNVLPTLPITLARLHKVIVQQKLNLPSEILQFHGIHSIWMLFNLFLSLNVNIMIDLISPCLIRIFKGSYSRINIFSLSRLV